MSDTKSQHIAEPPPHHGATATINMQPATATTPPKRQRLSKATADLCRRAFKTLGKDSANITVRSWLIEQGCTEFISDKQITALRRAPRQQRKPAAKQPTAEAAAQLGNVLLQHWGEFQDFESDIRDLATRCGGLQQLQDIVGMLRSIGRN